MPVMTKRALGGEADEQFEKNFADLAYSYVRDKAPALMDYLVGFQLVDRNEDDTKAAGVFGFQVNRQWFYVPVFFISGKVKGHELLYMKNQDMFVPLKEAWVNYLIHRKPSVLGHGTRDTISTLGLMQPDYRALSVPPLSKFGSSKPAKMQPWARKSGLSGVLAKWANDTGSRDWLEAALARREKQASVWNLEEFLGQDINLVRAAYELCERCPQYKQALWKFYGSDLLPRVAAKLAAEAVNLPPQIALAGSGDVTVDRPVAKVAVLTADRAGLWANVLDEGQKSELLQRGYVVLDDRTEKEAATEVRIDEDKLIKELSNPSETGLYDVLLDDGSAKECLVISEPLGDMCCCVDPAMLTVFRMEKEDNERPWANANRRLVWAVPVEKRDSDPARWQKWFNALTDERNTVEEGGTYLAVTPSGSGTVPFRVHDDDAEGEYGVTFESYPIFGGRTASIPTNSPRDREWDYKMPRVRHMQDRPSPEYCSRLRFSQTMTRPRVVGGVLHLPQDVKIVQIAPPPPKTEEDDQLGSPCCSSSPSLRFGDIKRLIFLNETKTARLELVDFRGSEMSINGRRMSKQAAVISLLTDWNLRHDDVLRLLKEAADKKTVVTRIKQAQPPTPGLVDLTQTNTYGSPTIPDPISISAGNAYGMSPPQQMSPMEVERRVPAYNTTNRYLYRQYPQFTDHQLQLSQQVGQQASQQGTRELFDTTSVGTLLKSVGRGSLIDRHLPDLFKALDSLGRIFVNFFWHNEDMEDRYGKQDLPELEDSLRNTFESLGDVLLFLKQKTIDPFSAVDSEPNLDSSGNN